MKRAWIVEILLAAGFIVMFVALALPALHAGNPLDLSQFALTRSGTIEEEERRGESLKREWDERVALHAQQRRVVESLVAGELSVPKAQVEFRRLNNTLPEVWKQLHIAYPEMSEEQILRRQLRICARSLTKPVADVALDILDEVGE